jgi:hypothetical protein
LISISVLARINPPTGAAPASPCGAACLCPRHLPTAPGAAVFLDRAMLDFPRIETD